MTEGLVQADLLDRANVRIGEKAEPASKPEIAAAVEVVRTLVVEEALQVCA